MCKEICAAEVAHLKIGRTGFKLSKEERALLPGREYAGPIENLTPEQQAEHRTFRRAYERLYRKFNKEKLKAYQGAYHVVLRRNHPEEAKIEARKQYLKNPDRYARSERLRRAREAEVVSERYLSVDILEIYGSDCYLCGEPIDLDAPRSMKNYHPLALHLDHVYPISKGGPDIVANVRPTHARCNLTRPKTADVNNTFYPVSAEVYAKITAFTPKTEEVKLGRPLKD